MISNPSISIIIPCYNQGGFLSEALQSVSNQTYSNWECVIINDGSKDNTEEIAKQWLTKDKRFCYYKKENSGVSSTRNFGLEKAKGEYIQFLDADDVLDKKKLEYSLNEFLSVNDDNIKVVISNFRMLAIDSKTTNNPYCTLNTELFNLENILYKWQETFSIPIHCGLFDASLFEKIKFPENLTAQEDWVVWVKIFKTECKALFINQPLALYRVNVLSRTMSKSLLADQLNAYKFFKTILNEDEHQKLSLSLISRYYKAQEELKNRMRVIKKSNPYQIGLLIKKVLKKIRLLSAFKLLLPIILKFKAKQ